nr:DUF4942 domain-containing protein [Pantoea sp. 1.19]
MASIFLVKFEKCIRYPATTCYMWQVVAAHYEDNFFSMRYFQKGTAHITFKRCDLTRKMNDILANHYPGMLASSR